MRLLFITLFCLSGISVAQETPAAVGPISQGNVRIQHFTQAKKMAHDIHAENPTTIYCPCKYTGKTIDLASCGYKPHKDQKRAAKLEWEHVVPAHAFGQAFAEWRVGAPKCFRKNRSFKGRKCAETNPEFSRMEADLYNLWPAIGELNGLRSNFSMAAIAGEGTLSFGKCKAKIDHKKFEPMDADKGIVARTYLYMEANYPGRGIISNKNSKLFAAWDKMYPVTEWECRRAEKIQKIQGNENQILSDRCRARRTAAQH